MSQSFGRTYLAIPGPSVVPDRVLAAMHRSAPNIYGGPLYAQVDQIYADLKTVARTQNDVAIYIGNGHAAWEAALTNTLSRGDKVLALVTGTFGSGWADVARGLGVDVVELTSVIGTPVSNAEIEEAIKQDKSHEIKAVLAVHTDTSTSVRSDISALKPLLDNCNHPALLMVDAIASLGCDPIEMDEWGIDVLVAASQKGLMTPPGLGFVYLSKKADQVHENADLVTPYWNWTPRCNAERFYQKFCGTAPTHHLFGLHEALQMLVHEEGVEKAWARHEILARAVWATLDCWGQGGPLAMTVPDLTHRSHSVTSVSIGSIKGTELRNWVENNTGATLGIGLGMVADDDPEGDGFFRIAHMGHVNAHMTLGVLGAMDAGLKAIGVPHGDGAVEAASAVIAGR